MAAVVLGAAGVSAQDVGRARRLFREADFENAALIFDQLLTSSALTRDEAVEAHAYLAALQAMLGDPQEAREHVRATVALDPTAQPPDGAPAEVSEWFTEARQAMGGRPAAISITTATPLERTRPGEIVARLEPAPGLLAQQLHLTCAAPEAASQHVLAPPPAVTLRMWLGADVEQIHCEASARTHANALLVSATEDLPVGAAPAQATSAPAPGRDAGDTPLWVWLAAGGGAVAAAIVAVLVLSSSEDSATLSSARVEGF